MQLLQSMKDILKKPYLIFYSILLFFTPLVFSQKTNELFEFPKMFFVYVLGFFIIFFFKTDILLHPVKLKKPSPWVTSLVLLTAISTAFSTHSYTSFFGYYSRFNDSLISYVVFFGLYFVGINKITKDDFEKLIKISLFSIIPLSFYGLSQYFNGVSRVYSTLGQPNWLAQYLGMLLPVCIYYVLKEDSSKFKIWFLIYAFGFFCLWVTFSMSGLLSFLVGVLFLLIKILKNERKRKIESILIENESINKDFKYRFLFLVAITVFIAMSNLGIYKNKIYDIFTDIKKQFTVVRKSYAEDFENIENKLSDPGFIRLELWKSTLNLIFSSPKIFFIGTGPETFPYVFQNFRNGKLNYSSEWDFVFNKPHNYYLEIWSESGVLSLIVFIVLLYLAFKKLPEYVSASIIVFGLSNIFGWPVYSTSLLFWFFLIALSLNYRDKKNFKVFFKDETCTHSVSKGIGIFLILLSWASYLFIFKNLSQYYNADIYYKKSQELIKNGDDEEALLYADRAILKNSFEPNYYRGRAKVSTVLLVSSNEKDKVKESISADLKKGLDLNRDNLVTTRNSIPIYYFLAIKDVYKAPGEGNYDEKYINEVRDFFKKTKEDYSNDVGVILSVAKYEKKLGLKEDFENSVNRIKNLRPDLLNWHESLR